MKQFNPDTQSLPTLQIAWEFEIQQDIMLGHNAREKAKTELTFKELKPICNMVQKKINLMFSFKMLFILSGKE